MKKHKLANVSPWLLAAACALLALIITVFAVNNYRREKRLMTEALIQRGLTIVRFVKSSTRSSLRGNRLNIRMMRWQWTDHVQHAIDAAMDQPGLRFLGLLDLNGNVLVSSESNQNNKRIDSSTLNFIRSIDKRNENNSIYRVSYSESPDNSVFQVASIYHPFGLRNFAPRMMRPGGRQRLHEDEIRRFRGGLDLESIDQLNELRLKDFILLVELDLNELKQGIRRQLLQILFLSITLLLVGVAGWISLLTLQGLKGSQSRLRQIRQFTDMLVSSLPVGLIATGNDGKIRIFNHSAENMVGIDASSVMGRQPHEILPHELASELQKGGLSHAAPIHKEVVLTDSLMSNRSLVLLALPVVDSDQQFAGNTLLMQDVSNVKDLQKELRRNERLAALGKMAAGVAHELRNPLSSIKGLALLLRTKVLDDRKGVDTADILVQEVERLNRSISELLDYARPDKLQLEKVQLSEVVKDSVTLIKADLDNDGITLEIDYASVRVIMADVDKLKQVFLNLLLNSIQALDTAGSIVVHIYEENNYVICQIDDNGCGLSKEDVTKVFDPYFTTKNEGTGLGLAMSAKIVDAHNGTIEFTSEKGVGTSVRVLLPASQEDI